MTLALLGACAGEAEIHQQFELDEIAVGDDPLNVLVASTPFQRRQGLSDLAELDGYDGMLFVYETPSPASYGMRDTLIALDIWWFDEGGHLLGTAEMEPCDGVVCTSYASPGPVMWVLETPVGVYDFATGARLSNVGNP